MQTFFGAFLMTFLLPFSAFAGQQWVQVAEVNTMADEITYRRAYSNSRQQPFSEVRIQAMSSGVQIWRVDALGIDSNSRPLMALEGDYLWGESRVANFALSRIDSVRLYLRSLTPGEPAVLKIWMR